MAHMKTLKGKPGLCSRTPEPYCAISTLFQEVKPVPPAPRFKVWCSSPGGYWSFGRS